jgi:hypothetical protein
MNWNQWSMWAAWAMFILGIIEALHHLGIYSVWGLLGSSADLIAGILWAIAVIVFIVGWFMGRAR